MVLHVQASYLVRIHVGSSRFDVAHLQKLKKKRSIHGKRSNLQKKIRAPIAHFLAHTRAALETLVAQLTPSVYVALAHDD